MSALPVTRPSGATIARGRDFLRLALLSIHGARITFARRTGQRQLLAVLLLTYIAHVTFVSVVDPLAGLLLAKLFACLPLLAFLALALRTALRIADPHRIVLLAPDRTSVIDVVAAPGGRIHLSHHTKLIGSLSAAPLRANVAEWLREEPHHRLTFQAPSRKVAAVYVTQFPDLTTTGRAKLLGGIELTLPRSSRGEVTSAR